MDKNIYNPYHPITFIGVKMFLLIGWQFIFTKDWIKNES